MNSPVMTFDQDYSAGHEIPFHEADLISNQKADRYPVTAMNYCRSGHILTSMPFCSMQGLLLGKTMYAFSSPAAFQATSSSTIVNAITI